MQLVPFTAASISFQVHSPRKRLGFAGKMGFIDQGAYFTRRIMVFPPFFSFLRNPLQTLHTFVMNMSLSADPSDIL